MTGVSYKIIGGDGREYGPIALNDVRDWIDDERVAPDTRVWSSEDERWLPAVERQELRWTFETHLVPPSTAPAGPGQSSSPPPFIHSVTLANRPPVLLRLAAIGCDYVLFTLALSVLTSPWSAQIREMNEAALRNLGGPAPDPKVVWDMLRYLVTAVLPASYLYYAALPALFGMTPGKFVARLVVVPVEDGGPLGWGRATARWLGALLCTFTFGIGFLPMFFTPRRQGLHDLIAGTCVLRRRD